ncbi:hypothetical protein ElyMa_002453800 [Elysia marginata]|uniref:Uncharacterized protein n=1 Tax=Elysia marginata TaxID=1093978 RepID=A0AAV4GKW4_9GAST|nr:hypothetical protein ElyMa_002453800 [Elysia marginata]
MAVGLVPIICCKTHATLLRHTLSPSARKVSKMAPGDVSATEALWTPGGPADDCRVHQGCSHHCIGLTRLTEQEESASSRVNILRIYADTP